MCYYIDLQDVTLYALFDCMGQTGGRSISFGIVNAYGSAVIRKIVADGQEAVFLCSREHAYQMRVNCQNLFEVRHLGEPDAYVVLNDGVSREDLLTRLVSSIPLEVLRAMMDENVLRTLRAAA